MAPAVLAPHCAVCGVPLSGAAAVLLSWRGIRRSSRNPNACTQCGAHLEEGRLIELTVLFADLSSFTAMTGRLGAEATHSVVDEYLRLAAAAITAQGGTVDKFIGDAVMAFFNAPIKRPDHQAAAVAAAERLQRELPALAGKLGVPLQASVGVAAGFARVGRLGSDDPKDYTAIGDSVNRAARLQAQARAGEILVSEAVYEKVAQAFPGVPVEELALKGFPEKTRAYRLNGAPQAPIGDADWLQRRPAMRWGAVALALLGSGCLGQTLSLAAALAYGAASVSALSGVAVALDHSPLHGPVLAVSAIFSVLILASLLRQRRQRSECRARSSCVEMTAGEKQRVAATAAVAVLSLGLVVLEELSHRYGKQYREPIARALSWVLP